MISRFSIDKTPAVPRGCWGLLFVLSLVLPALGGAAWGPWAPAEHPALRWEGRVRFEADQSAVFDWASVRAHASFVGSAVAIYARLGQNYLDVHVDGRRVAVLGSKPAGDDAPWAALGKTPLDSGGVPVYVVSGLAPGSHRLTLSKRTGPNFGPVTVLGLRFEAEAQVQAPAPARERRIEFVGDSLTNGYGAEGPGKQCAALPPYENSSDAWARLTAEALQAEAQVLAFSGYGLVRNYGAAGPASDDPVPFYYPRRVLADKELWPREQFQPQLSVVFLGTNDHSTQPHPKFAVFEEAYTAFLDQLREGRPNLKILLAYPDDQGALAKRVRSVVDGQQQVGRWVEGLALPNAKDEELGCDWHPKVAVHQRWAELATAKIQKMMEW